MSESESVKFYELHYRVQPGKEKQHLEEIQKLIGSADAAEPDTLFWTSEPGDDGSWVMRELHRCDKTMIFHRKRHLGHLDGWKETLVDNTWDEFIKFGHFSRDAGSAYTALKHTVVNTENNSGQNPGVHHPVVCNAGGSDQTTKFIEFKYRVHPNQVEEHKAAIDKMVASVAKHEPHTLLYSFVETGENSWTSRQAFDDEQAIVDNQERQADRILAWLGTMHGRKLDSVLMLGDFEHKTKSLFREWSPKILNTEDPHSANPGFHHTTTKHLPAPVRD